MSMERLVVFESMFGNTRKVAEAIAAGLRETLGGVTLGTVDDVAPEQVRAGALLVLGGPTQNYGITSPTARQKLTKARFGKRANLESGRESLKGWLDRLPAGAVPAAAFDTRYDRPRWLTGSAALKIARTLADKGYPVIGTESFFVGGAGGPLLEGQLERARAWGRELAAAARTAEAGELRAAGGAR